VRQRVKQAEEEKEIWADIAPEISEMERLVKLESVSRLIVNCLSQIGGFGETLVLK
jgi:hypothetical protein